MNNPKHEQLPCQQYTCGGPQRYCISQDLKCDGVNHCGDDSDEDERAQCEGESVRVRVPRPTADRPSVEVCLGRLRLGSDLLVKSSSGRCPSLEFAGFFLRLM